MHTTGQNSKAIKKAHKRRLLFRLINIAVILIAAIIVLVIVHNDHDIKTYKECAAKYPVQQSYPTTCTVPGGKTFIDSNQQSPAIPTSP